MAVAPSIWLIVEIIGVAVAWWLTTPIFNFFLEMAQANGWMPEVTIVIAWVWKLLPLIVIFGVIIGHLLWVARKDTVSGLQ